MTAHQQGQPHRAESILKDWLHPAAVRQAAYPAQLLAQGSAENGFALRLLTRTMDATVIPRDRTLH